MAPLPTALAVLLLAANAVADDRPAYVKKSTRVETVVATLKANGLPAPDGTWHIIGPFDNTEGTGFDTAYPPEKEIDLARKYTGKGGATVAWREFRNFRFGEKNNLARGAGRNSN